MQKIGLYIHIPFCKRGCFYCHFFKREYEPHLVDQYIRALVEEIRLRSNPGYVVDSLYIGGGSPSLLHERQVAALMGAVKEHFQIEPSVECTMEVNPEKEHEVKQKNLCNLCNLWFPLEFLFFICVTSRVFAAKKN